MIVMGSPFPLAIQKKFFVFFIDIYSSGSLNNRTSTSSEIVRVLPITKSPCETESISPTILFGFDTYTLCFLQQLKFNWSKEMMLELL